VGGVVNCERAVTVKVALHARHCVDAGEAKGHSFPADVDGIAKSRPAVAVKVGHKIEVVQPRN